MAAAAGFGLTIAVGGHMSVVTLAAQAATLVKAALNVVAALTG